MCWGDGWQINGWENTQMNEQILVHKVLTEEKEPAKEREELAKDVERRQMVMVSWKLRKQESPGRKEWSTVSNAAKKVKRGKTQKISIGFIK